jgi:ABC-type nickel/cobalt efflux system permease component RcnA
MEIQDAKTWEQKILFRVTAESMRSEKSQPSFKFLLSMWKQANKRIQTGKKNTRELPSVIFCSGMCFSNSSMTTEASFTFASAFTLGLLHSLEPSHAKAVLASYFLNHKRTAVEALAFAFTVTLAHTLMIYALAALGFGLGWALIGSPDAQEKVEQWSEILGGILMVLLGIWMFWNEKKVGFHKEAPCDESCGHQHSQGHFFHHHHYGHDHPEAGSLRQIFALGFCSGAIPCMSGLAVLTTAWMQTSPAYGFLLLTAFSGGLGIVVLTMCLAMQQIPRLMDRFWQNSQRWTRFLPIFSSALIFIMGLYVMSLGLKEVLGW